MKLYQTPDGTWAGTQAAWTKAMKGEGQDHKQNVDAFTVEVPTSKASLMEFLTFHAVNVVNPGALAPTKVAPQEATPQPPAAGTPSTTVSDLDAAFAAAPIRQQLDLAVTAIDAASARLAN